MAAATTKPKGKARTPAKGRKAAQEAPAASVTPSSPEPLTPNELERLKLSPEVAWYLQSRGFDTSGLRPPLTKTPEPGEWGVEGAVFDPERVDRVLAALHNLRHTQGEWYGRPLDPMAWQVAYVIAPVFGWVAPDDQGRVVRIVRRLFVEIPRKSGKTTIGAGLTAYLAFADGEPGAQVTCAATNEKQARFAFDPLRKLARETPALRPNVQVLAKKIVHPRTGSYVEVATSAADALHGANMHGGLIDELHVHKNGELVEVIETGTGSRRQPLILMITTADDSRQDTIYARRHDYTESLSRRTIEDPTFYGVIWAAPKDADPFKEETWAAANPGYPVTPTPGYLRAAAAEARQSPAELAKFLRLHLNIRTKQESRYFPMEVWDANGVEVDRESLRWRDAFGGADLANTQDVTALAWVVPDPEQSEVYDVLFRFWIPEERLPDLDQRTAGNASVWVRHGHLELTPGNVTDYEYIRQAVNEDMGFFNVQSLAIDRWNATHLASRLTDDGVPVSLMLQGVAHMSAPTKEFRRLLGLGYEERRPRLRHGNHPVARWMADHFAVDIDASGNVKPSKKRAADKIDGIVALIMALDRATSESPGAPNIEFV